MYFTDCVDLNLTWDKVQRRDFALSCNMKKQKCVEMSVTKPHITQTRIFNNTATRTSRDAHESFRNLLDVLVPTGEHPVSRNYDLQILTAFHTETRAICIATR